MVGQLLVVAATLLMIVLNGLAATGVLGGVNTAEVSARNPTVITPPSYAFAVWSVIYLGMLAFTLVQALPSRSAALAAIRLPYVVSCAANALWLWLWALEQLLWCQVAITVLLVALLVVNVRVREATNLADAALVRLPFGLYAGWVTAATLLNLAILAASLGASFLRDPMEPSAQWIACMLMLGLGAAGVFGSHRLRNPAYALGIAWATFTISRGHADKPAIHHGAAAACAACLLAAVWTALRRLPR